MTVLTIIAIVAVVLVAAAVLLILAGNRLHDRDYRPTIPDVIQHLEDCRAGKMDLWQYDEFSCCRIAYDPRLDAIRKRFNEITDDPRNTAGNFSETDQAALNDVGKSKIEELIRELHQMRADSA